MTSNKAITLAAAALVLVAFAVSIVTSVPARKPVIVSSEVLPEQRPANLRIEYREDGGMRYYSAGITLSEAESFYDQNNSGAKTHASFTVSPAELDVLYQKLRARQFEKISQTEEEVYDRGGTAISVTWGAKSITVDDASMRFVDEQWRDAYQDITMAILTLATDKMAALKKPVVIRFDPSIKKSGLLPLVSVDEETIYNNVAGTSTVPASLTVSLLPGAHLFSAALFDPTSDVYARKAVSSITYTLTTTPEGSAVVFRYRNERLELKQEK